MDRVAEIEALAISVLLHGSDEEKGDFIIKLVTEGVCLLHKINDNILKVNSNLLDLKRLS